MNSMRWRIDNRAVVAEILEGELIIMHSASGKFFSSLSVGPLVWQCLDSGLSNSEIHALVPPRWGAAPSEITADIDAFINDLKAEGVILENTAALATGLKEVPGEPLTYAKPVLSAYTDMQDLLLLDPIHEVSDEGWPVRPANA